MIRSFVLSLFAIVALPTLVLAADCKPGEDKANYRQTITRISGLVNFTEFTGKSGNQLYDTLQPHVAGMPKREGDVEMDIYPIKDEAGRTNAFGVQVYSGGCQAGGIIMPAMKFIEIIGQEASNGS